MARNPDLVDIQQPAPTAGTSPAPAPQRGPVRPARRTTSSGGGGGSRGGVTTTASGAPTLAPKSQLDLQDLALSYGLSYNEIQAIPGLKDLFQKAVDQGYSANRFTAELKNSDFWRTTSDTYRKFLDAQYSDPATWKQQWNNTAAHINALSLSVNGIDLSGQGTDMGTMNGLLQSATWNAYANGWSDEQVKSWLGGQTQFRSGVPLGGDAGRLYTQMHQTAYDNGRDYAPDWYSDQIRSILGGHSTIEQTEQQVRNEAAADYKAFATQIQAGQSARALAAPYLQSVSNLLEVPPDSLTLGDSLIRKAMTTTDKNGGAYSVWQLENDTRNDSRWGSTQNAQDSTMKLAHSVLGDFGLTF